MVQAALVDRMHHASMLVMAEERAPRRRRSIAQAPRLARETNRKWEHGRTIGQARQTLSETCSLAAARLSPQSEAGKAWAEASAADLARNRNNNRVRRRLSTGLAQRAAAVAVNGVSERPSAE